MSVAKPIYQIDLKTQEIINTYPSAKAAGIALGKQNGSAITSFITDKRKGKPRKSCYGFDWKYVDEDIDISEFKPFPENPQYLVSPKGEVYSCRHHRILPGTLTTDGYSRVKLSSPEKTYSIHRMVLMTFNPIEEQGKYYVNHKNGIRTDNRIENLEWSTFKQNLGEMYKNQEDIYLLVQQCIQTIGYEKTKNVLQSSLPGENM